MFHHGVSEDTNRQVWVYFITEVSKTKRDASVTMLVQDRDLSSVYSWTCSRPKKAKVTVEGTLRGSLAWAR